MNLCIDFLIEETIMTEVPLDTLKMAQRLEAAGCPMAQAHEHACLLAEVLSTQDASLVERFARKHDVSQELLAVKAALDTITARIEPNGAETKSELIRWVVSVGLLQMALIAGLLLKLVH